MSLTRAGIALFMAAVAFGPLYTVPGYSMTQHVISQLAAQHTPGNGIMATAFVLLGTAIVVDGLRAPRRRQAWPFIAFGLAFALAGLFGHRPIAKRAVAARCDALLRNTRTTDLGGGTLQGRVPLSPGARRRACALMWNRTVS